MKKGKFVYKDRKSMYEMHEFYDETLASLNVTCVESYISTSFGRTHSLLVGDPGKPRICTIHGGNGITTLNLKLFLPLLNDFSIIAPDVVGMPGKSTPYRNIHSNKDEYGIWIKEVLDHYKVNRISFAVSSYSSAMFLSFAKKYPQMVDKALLLVPSGIAHGPVMPMIGKMVVPFIKYYFHPTVKGLNGVIRCMGGKGDEDWRRFFSLMMSGYKMEMRPPREYKKEELKCINSPLLIIASDNDIFFPADRVFKKAREIFDCPVHFVRIKSKHLPSEKVMLKVCNKTTEFFLKAEELLEG